MHKTSKKVSCKEKGEAVTNMICSNDTPNLLLPFLLCPYKKDKCSSMTDDNGLVKLSSKNPRVPFKLDKLVAANEVQVCVIEIEVSYEGYTAEVFSIVMKD